MAEVRPIDANALYDQMTKGTKKYLVVEPCTKRIIEYGYHADDVLASIDQAPKLDYAPVRYGEWIYDFTLAGDKFYRCSVCGGQENIIEKEDINEHCPYCHCGAKMYGGNTDA